MLVVTGVLEMFVYVPTPADAAESVRQIAYLAPFGWLLRNMHYWAGQMMVGAVILHMARVVLSGGYKGRRFNWLIGMALLVLTLLLDFTGYVLRWDQDTAWALVTGTNLIDAIPGIGPGALPCADRRPGSGPGNPAAFLCLARDRAGAHRGRAQRLAQLPRAARWRHLPPCDGAPRGP